MPVLLPVRKHIGSSPFSTVIRVVLFVFQVTVALMSWVPPLETVAIAVMHCDPLAVVFSRMFMLVGLSVIAVTSLSVTAALAVAVALPEDAVIVALPVAMPLSNPPLVMVAVLVSELDQHTVVPVQLVPPVRVYVFPSLSVPTALSCSVLSTLTDGVAGSIVIDVMVGFTKNPVQLTARTKVASVENTPVRRSLFLVDDIAI